MSVLLCLAAVVLSAAPGGQIAYLSGSEPGDLRVHVLDVASKADTAVGPGNCDEAPVWSPDGAWIAFSTRQPQGMGIVLAKPDASETRSIPHANGWNRYPQWSPDGRLLAYETEMDDGFTQCIMVYDVEANVEKPWGGETKGLMRPVWLPNLKLLYTLNADPDVKDGNAALDRITSKQVIVAVGAVQASKALTLDMFFVSPEAAVPFPQEVLPSPTGAYAEWAAAPSPNGMRLAFESNDGGDREIFCYSHERAIDVSNHRAADWNPRWSPDSRWIAFESFRGGRRGIYRVYAETARVSPVADSPDYDDWAPAWDPDGKRIAFVSDRTGDAEVYVASTAQEDAIRLTEHPGPDYAPAWRPKGHAK